MKPRLRLVHLVATVVVLLPALAPADVQEQRARLPPPAACADPVEGTWMSHAYYPHVGQWYIFELAIRRAPPGSGTLAGEMHALYWNGDPGDSEPPTCAPGVYRKSVHEPAVGTIDGSRIAFNGTSWRADDDFCGAPADAYNLDNFSGTIDPALQEFQSVLNAPGWVDVPTVFRRVRCADSPQAPPVLPVKVAPPPIQPPGSSAGCGCGWFRP
ncbi:MAG: hypothetical protein HYY06_28525 [Deltaproteobacteria bacterium]|nr:hypothetical protein [Deltaproteobacteria bacterium]